MRPMTKRVKFAVQLSRVLPYSVFGKRVYNVEAVRIQNCITDGVFLFGKCVWVEKDLTNAIRMYDPAQDEGKVSAWYATPEGALSARSPQECAHLASEYGMRPGSSFSGPYATRQEAEAKSR